MKRKKDTVSAVVDQASTAADRVGPAVHSAADKIAPLAQSAADKIGPYAERAADKIGPYAERAADRLGPYAEKAADRLGPLAHEAKLRGAAAAADAVDRFGPALDDALDRVNPAVDSARARLRNEVLPKISEILHDAAEAPVVTEVSKRGKDTAAALKGEVVVKKKKKGRWVKRLAIIAVLGGAAAVVAKKLLGGRDDQWEAPAPATWTSEPAPTHAETSSWSTSTDSPSSSAQAATSPKAPGAEQQTESTPAQGWPAAGDADNATAPDLTPTEPEVSGSGDEAGEQATGGQPGGPDRSKYGEGAYVGDEPPEGFTIKGNERSMKYHLPDSGGYERTIAEVWFNSEEAAESAGFTKAQR